MLFMCYNHQKQNSIEKLTQKIKYYRKSGTIKKIYFIDNSGLLYGEYREFNKSGKLILLCNYRKDQLVGLYKLYDGFDNIVYSYDYSSLKRLDIEPEIDISID